MKEYKLRTIDGRRITVNAKSRGNAVKIATKNNQCFCEIIDNLKIKL